MGINDYEQVLVTDRAELRSWFAANVDRREGIWLVLYNKGSSKPSPSYDEIVAEALCFGWIDSTVRKRDHESRMLLLAPRKPNSTWSAVNKRRLEQLIPSGQMTEYGLRAIEVAKANGSWSILDPVERLEVPDDLAAALDAAGARGTWDGFPQGARKQMLWALISAKRPETRQQRLDRIVAEAAEGRRAYG
jgi:uncharacterized protein YdeI (YjbR/CyaY-like superfamily)